MELYTVTWDAPEGNPALLILYDNNREVCEEYRFAPVNPFDREMAYFSRCIEDRVQGSPSAEDGYNVDLIIDAMGESSRQKRPVSIDYRG
jgi:predicted dehydrogenase